MNQAEVRDRVVGRMILLDPEGRVLLFHGIDPQHPESPWWYTPGGGVEPGETPQQAAARELAEEVGLTVEPAALGGHVFHNYVEFPFDGVLLRQHNYLFLGRVASAEISVDGLDAAEQRTYLGHRWWTAEELERSGETYFPQELPEIVTRLRGAEARGRAITL
jgi:8-oxo-dGTP pyrophosphatase MutT (NUDIX family)